MCRRKAHRTSSRSAFAPPAPGALPLQHFLLPCKRVYSTGVGRQWHLWAQMATAAHAHACCDAPCISKKQCAQIQLLKPVCLSVQLAARTCTHLTRRKPTFFFGDLWPWLRCASACSFKTHLERFFEHKRWKPAESEAACHACTLIVHVLCQVIMHDGFERGTCRPVRGRCPRVFLHVHATQDWDAAPFWQRVAQTLWACFAALSQSNQHTHLHAAVPLDSCHNHSRQLVVLEWPRRLCLCKRKWLIHRRAGVEWT